MLCAIVVSSVGSLERAFAFLSFPWGEAIEMITQLIEHGAFDHDSATVVADDRQVLLDLAHVGLVRRAALQSWHLVRGRCRW